MGLDAWVKPTESLIALLVCIVAAARFAGRGPGILATVLSVLAALYFVIEPRYSFSIGNARDVGGLALLAIAGTAISLLARPFASEAPAILESPIGARWRDLRRLAVLGAALVLLVAMIGMLYSDLYRDREWQRRVSHTYEVITVSDDLLTVLVDAETGERGYLLTGQSEYLQPYESAVSREESLRRTLRHLTGDNPEQQARMEELDRLAVERLDVIKAAIALRQKNENDAALSLIRSGRGKRIMDQFRAQIQSVEAAERGLLAVRASALGGENQRMRWALGLGGGSLLVLLIVAGTVIERDFAKIAAGKRSLAESEEQFRTLANAIPQLCWMANADGWRTWYNQRWYDYTGADPEQVKGWGWQSVHAAQALPQVMERWRASLATGEPLDMTYPLRGSDGVFRPFLTRVMPLRDREGKVARWIGTNTDIREQKETERALRESEQRFRALVTASSDVIYRMTPDWSGMCQLDGRDFLADTTALNANWLQEYIHPDDQPHVMAVIREAIRTKTVFQLEHHVLRADGTLGWTFSRAVPVLDATGEIIEWFGAATDVTRRKEGEEQIRRLNAELERRVAERTAELQASNNELEAFAYSVPHDLRAPLRGIDGWSLALLEDYGASFDSKAQGYLQQVRSETQRMGLLIDDLLQLSRITRAEMRRQAVDLTRLAQSVAGRLSDSNPGRRIDFRISAGLAAEGDGRLIEVVLTNLLGNAVKFTGRRDEALVEFGQTGDNGLTAFYVRDNGAGFDMAYANNLFGAFQRLHKAKDFPGTGIGLATVQRIIRRHGGRVWAEAKPGEGATFYFTIGSAT
jgi:PAS domain S-box-containing protein